MVATSNVIIADSSTVVAPFIYSGSLHHFHRLCNIELHLLCKDPLIYVVEVNFSCEIKLYKVGMSTGLPLPPARN